ncbi:MAG: methylated-DNA--[protein]-cysteine S-methyltransferase, partial [Brevundimonas sp.]
MILIVSTLPSPVGPLALACDEQERLRGVSFGDGLSRVMHREYPDARLADGGTPGPIRVGLEAYFDGDQAALGRTPWSLDGAVAANGFQARVWRALADIPAGLTISYGEMARRAGEPGAAQAAGVALNRNPIAVVLPCHRVVGA